jgi:hypothetical protein
MNRVRIELTTNGFSDHYSNHLSYLLFLIPYYFLNSIELISFLIYYSSLFLIYLISVQYFTKY